MKDLEQKLAHLKQERDELRLQMHLATAELKDEWHEAERKLADLEGRLGKAGSTAKDAASEVGEALELLGEEIGRAFRRVREALR